jgi:hypothetical protein
MVEGEGGGGEGGQEERVGRSAAVCGIRPTTTNQGQKGQSAGQHGDDALLLQLLPLPAGLGGRMVFW